MKEYIDEYATKKGLRPGQRSSSVLASCLFNTVNSAPIEQQTVVAAEQQHARSSYDVSPFRLICWLIASSSRLLLIRSTRLLTRPLLLLRHSSTALRPARKLPPHNSANLTHLTLQKRDIPVLYLFTKAPISNKMICKP